jgi:hypothetical protein
MRARVPYAKHQFDGGGRTRRMNRGSRKRLSRISWRDNTPVSVWILFLVLLLMILGAVVWSTQQKANTKQTALRARGEIRQIPPETSGRSGSSTLSGRAGCTGRPKQTFQNFTL